MTGNSLAHKRITLRKHTKKLKSLQISVKQCGKAGTRALERDIALSKHKGYLLLITDRGVARILEKGGGKLVSV